MRISEINNNLWVAQAQAGLNGMQKVQQQQGQDIVKNISNQGLSGIISQANQLFEQTGNVLFKQIGQAMQGQSPDLGMLKNILQVAEKQNNEQAKTMINNIIEFAQK